MAETRQLRRIYPADERSYWSKRADLMDALAWGIDKTRFETKEEYEAEVERITKYYLDRDIYLRTELDKVVQNNGKVYSDTILGSIRKCF